MPTLYGCQCPHPAPVSYRRGPLPAQWRVLHRRCNYSVFNGYHHTPSDYSALVCMFCRRRWRSKGDYVFRVPDITQDELNYYRRGGLMPDSLAHHLMSAVHNHPTQEPTR